MNDTPQEPIPPIAKPEDLDFSLACRAYNGTSFTPEARARSDQQGYAADVNSFHAEILGLAKTDDQKAILAEEIERYRQNYLKHYGAYLASHGNVVSSMIAGPSNFPVRQMEKRGRWADNKRNAFLEWRTRARTAIKRRLMDARPAEEVESHAWKVLARDIQRSLAVIHGIDAGTEPYNRSAFVNSIAGKVERLAMNGDVTIVNKALELVKAYNEANEKPAITDRHKFWTLGELARQKATAAAATAGQEPAIEAKAEGIEIITNPQADRVQIFFDGKPPEDKRTALKSEGWRWSPSEGAWQRKLTDAAKASAKRITGIG